MRKLIIFGLMFLMMLNVIIGIPLDETSYSLTPEKNMIKIKFPDLTKEYNLKDEALKKGITSEDLCKIEKTVYKGDGIITLKAYQNITKEKIKSFYDCNCKDVKKEYRDNKTGEMKTEIIKVCDTCYIYENYTVKELIKINPETFKINKNTEIYEVFEGCNKIVELNNGKWGCSVWSDVNILNTEIKGATWWNVSYTYKRNLSCENMEINQPFLINGSNGFDIGGYNQIVWTQCSGVGNAIYYNNYSDYVVANDSSSLPFEVEKGNGINYNPSKVWGSNFKEVLHLDELSGNALDSSGNQNISWVGSPSEYQNTGKIGYAMGVDGVNDRATTTTQINLSSGGTIETWVKFDALSNIDRPSGLPNQGGADGTYNYGLFFYYGSTKAYIIGKLCGASAGSITTGESLISIDKWYYVTLTHNGSKVILYINGTEVARAIGGSYDAGNQKFTLGAWNYKGFSQSDHYMDGTLDETRVSNIERSADWINATYQNVLGTVGFGMLGVEEKKIEYLNYPTLPKRLYYYPERRFYYQ